MKQTKRLPIFDNIKLNPDEEILQCWNDLVKGVKDLPTHKSIDSKVCISNDYKSEQLSILIQNVRKKYSVKEIKESIENYIRIISSNEYYYEYIFKSLGFFLHSPKGLEQFLTENSPFEKFRRTSWNPFMDIKDSLDFVIYDSTNKSSPLNIESSTYFGVPLNIIRNIDVEVLYKRDLLPRFRDNSFRYGHLVWLEESIASLLFKKENLELLKKLMSIHRKISPNFKK